jgi:hypothetical protein
MPNTNQETGIPYGVVIGHAVPNLLDDICTSGDSLTYAALKEELRKGIESALADAIGDHCHNAPEIVKRGVDCAEIVEHLLDAGLNDNLQFEDEEYEYSDGEAKYLLGYLGGAPHVWVVDSPYLAYAPGCSPCIPGAGDLDNLAGADERGSLCYCCPPDCFDSEDESADKYEIAPTTVVVAGREFKIVRKVENVATET